ncbi:MAG: drug resistance transporter, EmrB/QacA subfamily [Candidatus Saccharibacteria bacterium]|nr:drug resistance transporter, EmrB/QacA subfamily [Candidatus Saccharibacteria bacterium]
MEEKAAIHHARGFSAQQKKIALLIVAFAFVMDLLDSTIVNVAIPSIQANLGASYSTIQWLVAGYSLTFALLLITGGRMGDVFGYKKIFMIGVTGFTIASLLTGIAPTPTFLVIARLIQGAMAALMVPQVMSLMQVIYEPQERAGVMGLFGMLGGLAASLGPIIGGLLIKANIFNLDWRPIFLINLPVGIFALVAGAKYLPDGKSEHPLHIDLVGTGIIIVALSLLVFPLIEGRDLDWPLWSILLLVLSIPALGFFGWYERRKDSIDHSALIVPALFKVRTFISGLGLNIIVESILIGYFLTSTLVMQIGLGYSPIKAALTAIPVAIGMTLGFAVLGQKLIATLGRRVLIVAATIFAVGLLITTSIFTHYTLHAAPWQFIPSFLITGIGLSLLMIPIFSAALQDVDPTHAGSASGILNAVQQVGAAIGIAIIGVIFFGQLNTGSLQSFSDAEPGLRSSLSAQHIPAGVQDEIVASTRTCFHDRSTEKDSSVVPASCKQAQSGPGSQAVSQAISRSAREANAHNFASAFRASIIYIILLLFVISALSFTLPKKFRMIEEGAVA